MTTTTYEPGVRFGLPAEGSGSVAPYDVRAAGFAIDALLVVASQLVPREWMAFVILAGDLVVLPTVFGWTLGQAVVGLRTVPVIEGRALTEQRGLTALTAVGRALLLVSMFPYLWISADDDRRFAHDRWTSSAVVRR